MRRRIHVSTPLTDMSENFGKNASAIMPACFSSCVVRWENQTTAGIPGTKPYVRTTNFLLARTFCRSMREVSEAGSRSDPARSRFLNMISADSRLLSEVFTLMLLTVCTKGSEQLRTTQNKRRFCSFGWLIPVVHAKLVHTV